MTLEECIEEILLTKFAVGDYFDSHSVIYEMQKNPEWHEVYMQNYPENCTVAQYHGLIAQRIGGSKNVLSADLKIKSHTIYDDLSENHLWKKL